MFEETLKKIFRDFWHIFILKENTYRQSYILTKELDIKKIERLPSFTRKISKMNPLLESWTAILFKIVSTLPGGKEGEEIGDISRAMGDC